MLKNKYYFDELYNWHLSDRRSGLRIRSFSIWMDRKVIDGFLHWFASLTRLIGTFLRNYIDKLIVNGFGDVVGEGTKRVGRSARVIQTGHIQQYMVMRLVTVAVLQRSFLLPACSDALTGLG